MNALQRRYNSLEIGRPTSDEWQDLATDALAAVTKLETAIKEAPHAEGCTGWFEHSPDYEFCDCWKHEAEKVIHRT